MAASLGAYHRAGRMCLLRPRAGILVLWGGRGCCSSLAGRRLACQCRAGHWDSGAEAGGHCLRAPRRAYRQRVAVVYGKGVVIACLCSTRGDIGAHAGAAIGRARERGQLTTWRRGWRFMSVVQGEARMARAGLQGDNCSRGQAAIVEQRREDKGSGCD